jgi:hypothetical protein
MSENELEQAAINAGKIGGHAVVAVLKLASRCGRQLPDQGEVGRILLGAALHRLGVPDANRVSPEMVNSISPDAIARAGILALAMSENQAGLSGAELFALAGDLHRSLKAGVAGKIGRPGNKRDDGLKTQLLDAAEMHEANSEYPWPHGDAASKRGPKRKPWGARGNRLIEQTMNELGLGLGKHGRSEFLRPWRLPPDKRALQDLASSAATLSEPPAPALQEALASWATLQPSDRIAIWSGLAWPLRDKIWDAIDRLDERVHDEPPSDLRRSWMDEECIAFVYRKAAEKVPSGPGRPTEEWRRELIGPLLTAHCRLAGLLRPDIRRSGSVMLGPSYDFFHAACTMYALDPSDRSEMFDLDELNRLFPS